MWFHVDEYTRVTVAFPISFYVTPGVLPAVVIFLRFAYYVYEGAEIKFMYPDFVWSNGLVIF